MVFIVLLEWVNEDENGVNCFSFIKKSDAQKCFEDLIADECNPNLSWVGEQIGEDDVCSDNDLYKLDYSESTWCFYETGNYNNRHTLIKIIESELR